MAPYRSEVQMAALVGYSACTSDSVAVREEAESV